MTDLKVVPIRDIVGRLRLLADEIESGEVPIDDYLMVIAPQDDFHEPYSACYGRNPSRYECIGLFQHLSKLALTDKE